MIGVTGGIRIWLAVAAVDGRKGFDTLCGIVRQALGRDPLCGDLFVFRNRSAARVRLSRPIIVLIPATGEMRESPTRSSASPTPYQGQGHLGSSSAAHSNSEIASSKCPRRPVTSPSRMARKPSCR